MTEHANNQQAYTRIPRWTAPSAGETGTDVHGTRLAEDLGRALARRAAALGTDLAALLTAAHARVLATVTAERDLLVGHVEQDGTGEVLPLRLHVANSTWAELVEHAAAAPEATRNPADPETRSAPPADARPEVVLDLSGLTDDTEDTDGARGTNGARSTRDARSTDGTGTRVAEGTDDPGAAPVLADGTVLRVVWSRDEYGLALRILHDRAALDEYHAHRLAGYHLAALRHLAADPADRHDRQSLLSERETEKQLYGLAGPRAELPDRTFHELFEEQARATPDALAAEHGGVRWTYRELDERADRVAHALVEAGAAAEDVVAVVMDRTLDWIAAALGVFKAGAVYLPVRPDFPTERVATQFERSACRFALLAPGTETLVREASDAVTDAPVALSVPEILSRPGAPTGPVAVTVHPGQAAYIYFTSGSTGAPKGALCEHVGMLNHLYMKIEDMEIAAGEVVTQTASQCFDISLWQFTAPLLVGGAVRIIDTDTQLDVDAFLDEITDGAVAVVQIVPSYLEVLLTHLEHHPRPLGGLRTISVTGEALKYELVQRWFAAHPGVKLVNAYGATEVSDDTMHEVLDGLPDRDFVTVGRSLRNVNTYILDENLALVPLGSPGEIAFSGVCVGRGYINDEERTRQAFVADPFRAGTRMYRTGDFGRWLPEGRIEYLGRRDEQVKIRGFRIEIGEIENKLLSMPGVHEAAVVIDGGAGDLRNLVAFFAGQEDLPAGRVRDFLATLLPDYMVPTYFHQMERLPLTENGKIDKKSLVRLAGTLGHGGAPYTAPVTPAEQRLAMLWAEVLGVPLERIGRSDNFFDLGGTSLAAVRLLVRLDRALSLKDLVARPALSDLAAVLDERGRGGAAPAATGLLQPLSAARAPHHTLVCFPYAGGNAVNYRSLAAELERDGFAVEAVELPGHDFSGAAEEMPDVPELARRITDEILERVNTPVLIWGHCAGAAAALETARLLEEAGRPAERVFLGALLLPDTEELRAEIAETSAADTATLLARLRADNAYVELDALKPERAEVVGRAYRHDVVTSDRHLARIREDGERYRIDAPVEVVVAVDDPTTEGYAATHGDWKTVSDRITLRELARGGHYFISTRPAETADVVRAACTPSGRQD
ncbi:amino acid adenylation domain-containing protein [Streptomyces zaomyceticus]|uniref:non-ribosomal peptide synthetase family protein n=1 Tax=Streptomyces zaomyceticus TaxID=68286 RepID=UPI00324B9309